MIFDLLAQAGGSPLTDVGVLGILTWLIGKEGLSWWKNGKGSFGQTTCRIGDNPEFIRHVQRVENAFKEDSPRKHTELLTDISRKMDVLREEMHGMRTDLRGMSTLGGNRDG